MNPLRTVALALSLALGLAAPALAQGQAEAARLDRAPVTASATSERIRFASPNTVARLKLEVLSPEGDVLFEASSRGSVLDWTLQDSQGGRLTDGSYLCVVTVKDVSGRLAQRLALVEIAGGGAAARAATAADLTPRQAEAVGPVEAEAAAPAAEAEAPAAALLAHDGRDGQLVTTAGDLVFRGGDFFTGRDRELMRLTSDGSLEVTGALVARGGVRFSDGTVLDSARGLGRAGGKGAKGALSPSSSGGDSASPSATAGRLAKFLDSSGTNLGDSVVTEAGGNLGVGTASPANRLDVVRGAAGQMGKGIYEVSSFEFDGDAKFGVYSSSPSAPSAALTFGATARQVAGGRFPGFEVQYIYGATSAANRMRFNYIERDTAGQVVGFAADLLSLGGDGSVTLNPAAAGLGALPATRLGIGTSSPQSPLHVAGDVRVSGAGTGIIFPDGSKQTTAAAGGGGVSGTGTAGAVPLWTGSSTLGNSAITQSGSNVAVAGDFVAAGTISGGNVIAKYQDVAEWVPGRGHLPAGTVAVLDRTRTNGVVPSRRAYSTHVAGVVSAQPGVILGEGGPGQVMVATTGRVRVKVDATRSPIRVGDLLVASDLEGAAMRSVPVRAGRSRLHRPGTIIGKALEPLATGRGEILVLLSLQ